MFSGIVKSVGVVNSIEQKGSTHLITISSPISNDLSIDQSVSHDGICLTIVAVENGRHQAEVILETLSKTTFQHLKAGDLVNLEKSITLSTLLDGHMVQGHVDTMLTCVQMLDLDGSWNIRFSLPNEYKKLVIPHGSICLNGVSLTIAHLNNDSFDVAIIPYTFENTNFKFMREGNSVNVEFDLIGKYLLRQSARTE